MGLRLKTCCGCGTLPTGTIIIAVLTIIGCILWIVNFSIQKDQRQKDNKAVVVIAIIVNISLILLSVLMIFGVTKKNWKFIVPWLVLDGVLIGLQLIYIIIVSAALFTYSQAAMGVAYLIIGLLLTALSIYLWLVPYSYHQDLKEDIPRVGYSQGPNRGQP